jgi:hypothetical protein
MRYDCTTGWPVDILPRLARYISLQVSKAKIKGFYIGRSGDPVRRMKAHGSDFVEILYRTDSVYNAVYVEDLLIKMFWDHPKSDNIALHGGGGTPCEGECYVYLACWT